MSTTQKNRDEFIATLPLKKTVQLLDGTTGYLSLPAAMWSGREEIGTGLFLTDLYFGARSGRCVERIISQWHGSGPEQFHEVEREEFAARCERVGVSVPDAIEAEVL